jgi:hypothetical protein
VIGSVLEHLATVPGWAVVTVVGLLVFLEDAVFVGFVLPGETASYQALDHVMGHAVAVTLAGLLMLTLVRAWRHRARGGEPALTRREGPVREAPRST